MLIGKLGRDPEFSFLPSGTAVCAFVVATSATWTEGGERKERTEGHKIKAWGKTAENCGKYLSKDKKVYIEGKLQTRQWDDKKSSEKRYATEIVAETVTFLTPASDSRSSDQARTSPREFAEVASSKHQSLDDLPF
ncbi:MAG: single-stranded DNA-binding protein [Proteobacteria bacterium]|nr:MAG: single-stranded DNA-binding protein [Pseudomonadota bacterium]